MHRRLSWLAGALLLVVCSAYFLFTTSTQAAPAQPVAFNHAIMVQEGIPCLYCHSQATKSPVAGMPSVDKCMGCHTVIAPDSPEVKKLAAYWARQEPIQWVRVNRQPRFVYFSHQVHVDAAGLNCERCHGDVGHMSVTYAPIDMNMGFCLTCHAQQSNAKQLMECNTCHK